jgi:hypothetical protein
MLSLAQGLHPWPQAQANLAEQILVEGVPGDFIETDVWRGGACILLREALAISKEIGERWAVPASALLGNSHLVRSCAPVAGSTSRKESAGVSQWPIHRGV